MSVIILGGIPRVETLLGLAFLLCGTRSLINGKTRTWRVRVFVCAATYV